MHAISATSSLKAWLGTATSRSLAASTAPREIRLDHQPVGETLPGKVFLVAAASNDVREYCLVTSPKEGLVSVARQQRRERGAP